MSELTTIFSESRKYKIEIEQRPDDLLQLTTLHSIDESNEENRDGLQTWAPTKQQVTITDSWENAQRLAREKIETLP